MPCIIAHIANTSPSPMPSSAPPPPPPPPPSPPSPPPPHPTVCPRRRQTFMVFRRRAGPFRAPGVTCTGLPRHSRRASAEPGVCRADACVGVSACRVCVILCLCVFVFVVGLCGFERTQPARDKIPRLYIYSDIVSKFIKTF